MIYSLRKVQVSRDEKIVGQDEMKVINSYMVDTVVSLRT